MANPASQNCEKQGGSLTIEQRPDGGQYGVCYFADNMQCEEWALMRGECPVGGVKVTGYTTPAATYLRHHRRRLLACRATAARRTSVATCALPDGRRCEVWSYYLGGCASPVIGMANPASQNCMSRAASWRSKSGPDGGQYGVCYFEDNRQCEEWALLRGQCPVGGVKVTGYTTPAATYCAITGGTYTATGKAGQPNEAGHVCAAGRHAVRGLELLPGRVPAGRRNPIVAATDSLPHATNRVARGHTRCDACSTGCGKLSACAGSPEPVRWVVPGTTRRTSSRVMACISCCICHISVPYTGVTASRSDPLRGESLL